MSDWTFRELGGDYIPASGWARGTDVTPDYFDINSAPVSLNASRGDTTYNFRYTDGTIIVNCHCNGIAVDEVAKAIRIYRGQLGPENVKACEILLSPEMVALKITWLDANKFERIIIANQKTGMFRFRREFKFKPKKFGEDKL